MTIGNSSCCVYNVPILIVHDDDDDDDDDDLYMLFPFLWVYHSYRFPTMNYRPRNFLYTQDNKYEVHTHLIIIHS
jgi:hypothetical protein